MAMNLQILLSLFDRVCKQKFGRTYDFVALERHFQDHASGKRHLTAKDVAKLFAGENTPFAKYWPRPHVKVLEETLAKERVYFGSLITADVLVERLLAIFHNIGTASLLLRFVHPNRFGIFSTPVIHLLQVSRAKTIDLYISYCDELAHWCQHFGLHSVAQTEMALWTYAEMMKLPESDAEAANARREFEEDMWIQRQRAAQVLRPFLHKYGRLQLAEILLDEDPILAGKIAAEEYERLLENACWHLRRRGLPREKGAAERLLEELGVKGYIRLEDKIELQRVWQTRNKVVHPSGKRPERAEVEVMIDLIQRICVPWEKCGLRVMKGSSRQNAHQRLGLRPLRP